MTSPGHHRRAHAENKPSGRRRPDHDHQRSWLQNHCLQILSLLHFRLPRLWFQTRWFELLWPPRQRLPRHWFEPLRLLLLVAVLLFPAAPAAAAPGLCVGPVCGDQFSRAEPYPWQLRLRLQDQRGHRERLVVDCRDGSISPLAGPIDRGYAAAVGRRACRMAPLTPLAARTATPPERANPADPPPP